MHPVLLEDIAVDTCMVSSFGRFVMVLFQPLFRATAWHTFSLLACGWAVATGHHTITTYLWLTGATKLKHFSRFYVFLGDSLYKARWQLWAQVIRQGVSRVGKHEPIVLEIDDFTKKKAGRHIEGLAHYRNSAGSARQEYRTLRGVNFVLGVLRLPLPRWPGHCITVPIGLALYLKEPVANTLHVAYRSRSTLARESVDFVANTLPERAIRVLADGGYATKEFLRHLPRTVPVVSRLLITAQLYEMPTPPTQCRPGRPPRKGKPLGSPKTLARKRHGWLDHPVEAGTKGQSWVGLWHSVLPGCPIRVVIVRRKAAKKAHTSSQRKPRPLVEAFFTTDLTLSLEAILNAYGDRWAVEIDIRDGQAFYGLGQDQCRKWRRIVGVNTFRLTMAAARTLWFVEHTQRTGAIDLCRYRPWYRHKVAPSQLDIVWMCREALHAAGVSPIVRFHHDVDENQDEPENTMPLAA
jgi:DDE superfamily endonuclease